MSGAAQRIAAFNFRTVTATPNQTRYVRSELAEAGSYMISMGHLVQGQLDETRFRAAATQLVLRHDALRTSFDIIQGAVQARISEEPQFQYHSCRLADDSLSAFRSWALPLVFEDVDPRVPGSLIRVLVANLGEQWRFTIAAHHATTDGFSRGVMTRELLKLYAGEDLPSAPSYYDIDIKAAQDPSELRAVNDLVTALPQPVRLIGDGFETGEESSAGHFVERSFDDLSRSVRMTAKSIGTTKFGLFSAVYALGLHGYSGETQVSSFFQTSGRKVFGASNSIVGPYSNTLPLDLSFDPGRAFGSFARDLAKQVGNTVALERAPILDAVLAAQKGPSVSINMFPPAARIKAGALEVGPREFLDRRTEFDLNLVWAEDGGVLTARAFYDKAHLSDTRARLFLDQQARLLRAVLADPAASCRDILKQARSGAEALLPQGTTVPTPRHRLHNAFLEWAARTPDAVALVTSKDRLTYKALADRLRARVAGLQDAGAGPGNCVVIFAQRDPALVEALLAVSASGASFAIIDASYPPARISQMFDRLEARFVIEAGAELPPDLRSGRTLVACGDPARARVIDGPPRDAACHMFTSGTTGQPKLISHPDQTVQRFVAWQAATLALDTPVVTMMMAGLAHDPTLRDVLLPLSHGGTVAVPTPCEMATPERLRALMATAQCNVVRFSPASARLLTTGASQDHRFDHLCAIFWGGERLPRSVVAEWQSRVPKARQFNVFGTTETPQAFLIHEIQRNAPPAGEIPLGRTLPWTGAAVLAEDATPVAIGEVGELTAMLADPIIGANDKLSETKGAGALRHFTGDLAYMMPGGEITFAGRRDGQVKINGFRVELGEIEAFAEGISGVKQATALVADDRILLFVLAPGTSVAEGTVKARLAQNVPAYMVPAQILVLDGFPATPNGKVDKPALVALAAKAARAETGKPDAQPKGAEEIAISKLLARNTNRTFVARNQSLADLGIDSIGTIEARLDLEGAGFTLPDGWQWLTVSELAAQQPAAKSSGSASKRWIAMGRMDSFILIRALAIAVIVAFHTGLKLPVGASIILFVLTGFAFVRMQLPAILRDDHAGRILTLMARLIVPMAAISLVYYLKHTVMDNDAHLSTLLPYRNLAPFFEFMVLGRDHYQIQLEFLWFLHSYLQMFLVIGVLLAVPRIRALLRRDL
ncbi:AMP-binding protein [Fluviibacterium sp. S390]|uniref:AMP-binding protein n=1 Tax=Fluviibacterium sp. S390 TaxID=3415139 RepID=UPI003C7CF937